MVGLGGLQALALLSANLPWEPEHLLTNSEEVESLFCSCTMGTVFKPCWSLPSAQIPLFLFCVYSLPEKKPISLTPNIMAQNEAAWITSPSEYPFTVKEGPKPTAGAGEIVIKNAAVSIVRFPMLMSFRSLFHI